MIDEYDTFSTFYTQPGENSAPSWNAAYSGDLVKAFFAKIKKAYAEGFVQKVFITGISPLVLTGCSSGFNISRDISFEQAFASMCGFTDTEVRATIVVQGIGSTSKRLPLLFQGGSIGL